MNAAVDQRAPLSFAAGVGQLIRFDLRRFHAVLALFAALEIARAAFAEWFLHRAALELDGRFGGDGGHGELAVLDAALWLATVIATAMVVQADHPADDRAFWRTRPVAPLELATGKLVLLAGLFVALPAIVNAVRLLAYGAPIASVAASAAQFAVLAGATVLPAWGLAIATRTLPAFLAACAGLVIALFLAFSGSATCWRPSSARAGPAGRREPRSAPRLAALVDIRVGRGPPGHVPRRCDPVHLLSQPARHAGTRRRAGARGRGPRD